MIPYPRELIDAIEQSAPRKPTRGEWQRSLENNIQMFNGDAIEASELLCAVIGGLRARYDRGQLSDVQGEFERLKEALEELDATTCEVGKEDDAYADFRARQECDG